MSGGHELLSQKTFYDRCLMPQVQAGFATNSLCDIGCVILNVAPIITVSVLVPHLISFIRKVKNNHWLTLTKILQPSASTLVKLDQMICKEPSCTLIWWLDVLFA